MKKLLIPVLALTSAFACAQNGNYHLDKEFSIASGGTVKLISGDARVVIQGSDRSNVHVRIDRDIVSRGFAFGAQSFTFDITEEDGNIELHERSHSTAGVIGYSSEKYTILLELPSWANINIQGGDGDYQVKSMAGAVALSIDDANAVLTGCTGDNFYFHTNDGGIRMDQGKGKISITGDDSDVRIEKGAFTEVYGDVRDGNFYLETSLSETGSYRIRAKDGMVSLGVLNGSGGLFTVHHDDGQVVADGKFNIIEKSDTETRLTLLDGKARVEIRVDDARVKLASR